MAASPLDRPFARTAPSGTRHNRLPLFLAVNIAGAAFLQRVEQTRELRAAARAESIEKVRKALAGAGITFLPDDGKGGVGVRGRLRAK